MILFIYNYRYQTQEIELQSSTTVLQLKQWISNRLRVPVNQIRLDLRRKTLDNNKTMEDYHVRHKDRLLFVQLD